MNYHKFFGKHKCLEINLHHYGSDDLFNFDISLRFKGDHPGFFFFFGLFGYCFDFSFYDGRHWDNDRDCFEEIT